MTDEPARLGALKPEERTALEILRAKALEWEVATSPSGPLAWYRFGDLCVEVDFDRREQAAFGLLSEWDPTGRASGYYLDDTGRRVRWHLAEILQAVGQGQLASDLKTATRRSGSAAVSAQLSLIVAAVTDHLPEITGEVRRRTRGILE